MKSKKITRTNQRLFNLHAAETKQEEPALIPSNNFMQRKGREM